MKIEQPDEEQMTIDPNDQPPIVETIDDPIERNLRLLLSFAEEVTTIEDLRALLKERWPLQMGRQISYYDGFEPSGRMHIAQGLIRVINIEKIIKTGGLFTIYIADEFAFLNGKFGGDRKKIRKAGELMVHTWRACGLERKVDFRWASEEMKTRSNEYWPIVLDISTKFSLSRMKKCMTALGKEESDELPLSSLLYADMQAADIPFLRINVASLGMDQRKILMLNREYASKMKKPPPIALLHHILLGLNGQKMSKSDPENAIFMDDAEHDVRRKIRKAFCPPHVEGNPIMEYAKYIIFEKDSDFTITRKEENGGDVTYPSYAALETDYQGGWLHPADLKAAVANRINFYLDGVRKYFENNPEADKLRKEVARFR